MMPKIPEDCALSDSADSLDAQRSILGAAPCGGHAAYVGLQKTTVPRKQLRKCSTVSPRPSSASTAPRYAGSGHGSCQYSDFMSVLHQIEAQVNKACGRNVRLPGFCW